MKSPAEKGGKGKKLVCSILCVVSEPVTKRWVVKHTKARMKRGGEAGCDLFSAAAG